MKMTKQHFELVASALRTARNAIVDHDDPFALGEFDHTVAPHMAAKLAPTNPNFRRFDFLVACGVSPQDALPAGWYHALRRYAKYHGARKWKEQLRNDWARAYYGSALDPEIGGILQAIRNHPDYGPGSNFIETFKFPKEST